MGNDSVTPTIPQQGVRRAKTAAERQRAYRDRQRLARQIAQASSPAVTVVAGVPGDPSVTPAVETRPTSDVTVTSATPDATTITRDVTPVTLDVTSRRDVTVTQFRRHGAIGPVSSYGITTAALALAATGLVMNGWYARSLGSTDFAGYLFLAIGAASDLVALSVPSTAIRLWHARARITALVAWLVWLMTFAFVLFAGIGFASVNVADATLERASRVTPAVSMARDALRDAVTSRDRECAGGVGRFCREREQAVAERQRALDAASNSIEQAADPQIEAVSKIVAWLTGGTHSKSSTDSFAMVRLILLALLPQIGGILLMLARALSETRPKH